MLRFAFVLPLLVSLPLFGACGTDTGDAPTGDGDGDDEGTGDGDEDLGDGDGDGDLGDGDGDGDGDVSAVIANIVASAGGDEIGLVLDVETSRIKIFNPELGLVFWLNVNTGYVTGVALSDTNGLSSRYFASEDCSGTPYFGLARGVPTQEQCEALPELQPRGVVGDNDSGGWIEATTLWGPAPTSTWTEVSMESSATSSGSCYTFSAAPPPPGCFHEAVEVTSIPTSFALPITLDTDG